jgi:hypothetical protein
MGGCDTGTDHTYVLCWGSIPDPGSRVKKIQDPGSASKNLSIYNPINCFHALGKMMFIPDPDPDFFPHPVSRIHSQKMTGSRIRNTAIYSRTEIK